MNFEYKQLTINRIKNNLFDSFLSF